MVHFLPKFVYGLYKWWLVTLHWRYIDGECLYFMLLNPLDMALTMYERCYFVDFLVLLLLLLLFSVEIHLVTVNMWTRSIWNWLLFKFVTRLAKSAA